MEEPILKSEKTLVLPEAEDLFYKGSKVLSQNIVNLKKLIIKLENDQLNYEPKLEQSVISEFHSKGLTLDYLTGLIFGFLLSFVIIFFKSALRSKQ